MTKKLDVNLHIRLPKAMKEQYDYIADQKQVKRAVVIRWALIEYPRP